MEPYYMIDADMKILGGWSNFGTFKLGKDRDFVLELWREMLHDEAGLLRLKLIAVGENMEVLGTAMCTLVSFERNCKFITKEIFRIHHFKGN